jgi:hypothetical protein
MRSKRLRELDTQCWLFRRKYLPRKFSNTGNYTNEQYRDAAIFRLLVHAELETYFEQLALEILGKALHNINNGTTCKAGAALVSLYSSDKMHGMPTQKDEMRPSSFLVRTQLACANDLRRKVDTNRGVKSYNILQMFIPLGMDETAIDEQLLVDLNTLASKRGDVAHHAMHDLKSLPDPKEEMELTKRIVKSLVSFEKLVANLT